VSERPAFVRTVLGDVAPAALGMTLGHEHLLANPPAFVTDVDLQLTDEHAALRELSLFRRAGGGAVVEMTTVDYGRDTDALGRLSRASKVHLIAATGFNQGKFADGIVAQHSDEQLVEWLVAEVMVGTIPYERPEYLQSRSGSLLSGGTAGTRPRAGLIKASSGPGGPSAGERRGLGAAAEAHRRTGAPIGTHTEKAAWGLEQAQLFIDAGVPANKVLIGHQDFRPELDYLLEVASTGVNLGFDQFSKQKYLSDHRRVELVSGLAAAGHLQQIILSGDLARRSYWPSYGHSARTGFAHISSQIRPMLLAAGLSAAEVIQLLERNPQRWLEFAPAS